VFRFSDESAKPSRSVFLAGPRFSRRAAPTGVGQSFVIAVKAKPLCDAPIRAALVSFREACVTPASLSC
jgi:hypothetical protein